MLFVRVVCCDCLAFICILFFRVTVCFCYCKINIFLSLWVFFLRLEFLNNLFGFTKISDMRDLDLKGFPVLNCCFNFMNNEEICFLPMPISIGYWPMQRTHRQKNRANSYSEKKLRVSWGLNLWRSVWTKARCWCFIQLSSHILVLLWI